MCRPDDFPPYSEGDRVLVNDGIFRSLSPEEERGFREWAHANWQPGQYVNPLWHPVVRDECERMIADAEQAWEARTERGNR